MLAFGTAKTADGEDIGIYFDPQSKRMVAFEVVDTEIMLGDVPAQYLFDDYKAVDGITLPHRVTIRKGGKDYSDVRYAAIAINDPQALAVFAIPESAAAEADRAVAAGEYTPLALTKVADKVLFRARLFAQQPDRGISQLHRRRRSAVHGNAEQGAGAADSRAVPQQADPVRRGRPTITTITSAAFAASPPKARRCSSRRGTSPPFAS